MHKLSKKSINLLLQAGWSEDRSIDTATFEKLCKDNGMKFFPVVADFLRIFGNLRMVNPHAIPPAAEDWQFDVAAAVKYGANIAPYYGHRLGGDVCMIGQAQREYMLLMMNEQGQVYAGYDQLIWFVGDSGIDAINALSEGRKLTKVPG